MFAENQQIGAYRLIRKIGKGGFGEVWLAEKQSHFLTKRVALKLPHDEEVDFNTIKQEATLWEQASGHPNVLPIIDADIYDGQAVIVSEYAEGGSLSDKLKAHGKFTVDEAIETTIGILSGLEFLHYRQIIHRDIKPQNILMQGDTPRLADFGISRAIGNTMTLSLTITGTEAYMAPEAFDGKRNVQTDVWSVGVVLYQLLTGKLPFPQGNPSERMFAILQKDYEPLPPEIPPALQNIIKKALAKNPQNRYKTAREMLDALKSFKPNSQGINKGDSTDNQSIAGKETSVDDQTPDKNLIPAETVAWDQVLSRKTNLKETLTQEKSVVTQINTPPQPIEKRTIKIFYAAGLIILIITGSFILIDFNGQKDAKDIAPDTDCKKNDYQCQIDEYSDQVADHPYTAYYRRAAAYEKLGKYQEAISDYNYAFGLDPYNTTLESHIKELKSKYGSNSTVR